MQIGMRDVGVVYLYRFAEDEIAVRTFLQTYHAHPAGIDHDLIVAFKGFPDRDSLARGRALFAQLPITSIELDDAGYDIGSYVQAAKLASCRRLMFLNTFSQILSDNWLQHFDRALSLPRVGLVGATGSWLANTGHYEARIRYVLNKLWKPASTAPGNPDLWQAAQRHRPLRRYLLAPLEYLIKLYEYGRYPNPHIRTNAFMMERDRFLSIKFPNFATKTAAYKFESGRHSMTNQVLAQNLLPVVVDRDGKVYEIPQWKSSRTFWTDEQANLIIADNRTMDYAQADWSRRRLLEDAAWAHPWEWYSKPHRPSGAV